MTQTYYPNPYREQLIYSLGLKAYYEMLEKIDEIMLILSIIIERLEQTKKELEEKQHGKKKRNAKAPPEK
jgi:hypothetical protein